MEPVFIKRKMDVTKQNYNKIFYLFFVLFLMVITFSGCSSSNSDALATETDQSENVSSDAVILETEQNEYTFWKDIAKNATEKSVELLNQAAGLSTGNLELIVLTNAGYAMVDRHSTEACLDGLRENADVSEGRKNLLSVHSTGSSPLWFFIMDKANGNGVYSEIDPDALDLVALTIKDKLFLFQNLRNVHTDNLFADLSSANESIFNQAAFNGNEFRIIGLANLLLKNGPYDLIRSAQYHDHYCPGVTSGYYIARYIENNFPPTPEYGKYFVLSIPPWCKDDAMMTMLNATPGKRGYGVFYLNSDDTALLKDDAKNIAGIFFRWNGDAKSPKGEGIALTFDFTEAKAACNWGQDTTWNWWEARLKMNLWYLDYLNTPEKFITAVPVTGKDIFSLNDLADITQPSDLVRPGVNPLEILGLLNTQDTEYSLWQSVGKRSAQEGLALIKSQGVSPTAKNLIALTNAGYAEISGKTTQACLDGLTAAAGLTRGNNNLIEIQSRPASPLWFAIYDRDSGFCSYLQVNPDFLNLNINPDSMIVSELFTSIVVEKINADHLYANAAEYAAKFDNKIFSGNEFRIVTIANAINAGAPNYAVRSFEFHDHYCPGVTSGILMAQYVKKHFPMQTSSDSYFVQTVQPWCKEDALMVMLNATPGKRGYAVTYPTDDDKAKWVAEAENASTIVYRKNGDTGIWDGLILGFDWADTGCPDYGSSVITKLCSDLWYLEQVDNPEIFVKVIKEFQLPEGVEAKEYARPGTDPMKMLGLTIEE